MTGHETIMIVNLLVILFTLLIPVLWSSKAKGYGMFSAFLGALSALAAGGIAFGVWEPFVYGVLMPMGKDSASFLGGLIGDTAWGLGLLVPYVVSLLVFRFALDSLVRANMFFSEKVNLAGGLAFGLVTSVITVGITVISIGFMRLPPDMGLGYSPVVEKNGNVVYENSLWLPVDKLTVGLYEHLSRGSFGSSTPLAVYRPAAHEDAGMQRMTYKGKARTSLMPDQFEVKGSYKVSGSVSDLLSDGFIPGKKQTVVYTDGNTIPPEGSSLYGYVVHFGSGAKEKGGNVVLTPGQVRLICRTNDGGARAFHPIAAVAPPEAGSVGLYRFRFDAPESLVASLGGGSDASFAFEFVVPGDCTPLRLLIKNTATDVAADSGLKETAYARVADRDAAIKSKSILESFGVGAGGASSGPLDTSSSTSVSAAGGRVEDIEVNANLPDSMAFNRQNRGPLSVNDKNEVTDGEHVFPKAMLKERGIDRNLRVEKFASSNDTGIVKVTLSRGGARSIFGQSVETAETVLQPFLIDSNGSRYEPVGFLYDDGENVRLRYTPGQPIRALAEIPALSRTKRDQTLILIFRPTRNAKLVSFSLGNKEVAKFSGGGVSVQ